MKSRVIKKKDTNILSYPKLMISNNGNIVLFTEDSTGTMVNVKEGIYSLGCHDNGGWEMNGFEDFYGEVILSNV